jgi:hypothetical protein
VGECCRSSTLTCAFDVRGDSLRLTFQRSRTAPYAIPTAVPRAASPPTIVAQATASAIICGLRSRAAWRRTPIAAERPLHVVAPEPPGVSQLQLGMQLRHVLSHLYRQDHQGGLPLLRELSPGQPAEPSLCDQQYAPSAPAGVANRRNTFGAPWRLGRRGISARPSRPGRPSCASR